MSSIKHKRRESMYFDAISTILGQELTNANVSYPTVTEVKLSGDDSHLVVYVTFESHKEKSIDALNNAKGFVRSQIAKLQNQRKVPDIIFKLDEVIDQGQRIDAILEKIKKSDK